MTDDERVDVLVDLWETLCLAGREPSADEICRDAPELLELFKERRDKLKRFEDVFGSSPADRPSDDIGTFCHGRYEVGLLHDQGGLGAVYLARDLELGRTVLVKAIRAGDRERPQAQRQFVNEATITGQLEHPGVVPVFGFGRDEQNRPYYAMRMIRGMTLRDSLRQYHQDKSEDGTEYGTTNLAFQRLLRSFLSVCQTIEFAHSRGVVHRDIKPTNIMIGGFGEVIVVDWGLAKHVSAPDAEADAGDERWEPIVVPYPEETRQGDVKGSPIYMSPEQATGHTETIGPASDIYSLGATLYEVLTGCAPFGGPINDVIQSVRLGKLPPPREARPDVPPALEAICLKAMHREPLQRYSSAQALADDIENYLADEPVSAYPEPLVARARRWTRRHRGLVAGGAATVLVMLVALLAVAGLLTRHNYQLSIAKKAADDARAGAQVAEQAERRRASELEKSLYVNQLMLAGAAWADDDLRRTRAVLRDTTPKLRSLEWNLADRQTRSPPPMPSDVSPSAPERMVTGVQWNSTGTWLHVEHLGPLPGSPTLVRSHRLHSTAGIRPALGAAAGFLAFSPDGTQQLRRINVEGSHEQKYRLALIDLANGSTVWQTEILDDTSYNLFSAGFLVRDPIQDNQILWLQGDSALANDSSPLVIIATDKWATLPQGEQVRIVQFDFRDAATGRVIVSIDGDTVGNATRADFDPAGRVLVLSTSAPGTHTVSAISTVTGKALYQLKGHTARINAVAFSADSKWVATASADRSVRVWDATTGQPRTTYWGSRGPVFAVAFNSAGDQIAGSGEDSTVRIWNVSSGEMVRVVPVYDQEVFALAFSRDDALLYFGGTEGAVSQIDLHAAAAQAETVIREQDFVSKVRLDPSGTSLAAVVSGASSAVRVYDRASQGLRFQIELYDPTVKSPSLYIEDAAFSPDGALLAIAGDNFVRVVDAQSGATRWELPEFGGPLIYTPDGKSLVAYRRERTLFEVIKSERLLDRVDADSRKWLNILLKDNIISPADDVLLERLTRNPANRPLIETIQEQSRGAMCILAANDGKPRRVLPAAAGVANRFAMHPTRPIVAIAAGDVILLWDLDTGQQITAIEAQQGTLWCVSFSPDGERLVVVGIEQQIASVIDLRTGKESCQLVGSSRSIQDAKFTPDGIRIVTCSVDGTLRVWDADTGSQLWILPASNSPLYSVAITQAGRQLVAAGGKPGSEPLGLILGWSLTSE